MLWGGRFLAARADVRRVSGLSHEPAPGRSHRAQIALASYPAPSRSARIDKSGRWTLSIGTRIQLSHPEVRFGSGAVFRPKQSLSRCASGAVRLRSDCWARGYEAESLPRFEELVPTTASSVSSSFKASPVSADPSGLGDSECRCAGRLGPGRRE
jgi:hypothetical protein